MPAGHHLVATGAPPEAEAGTRDQVECGRGLREQRGRPAEHVDDAGAELDALGASGEGAKNGDGVGAVRLWHPHGLEPEGLGALSELNRLGEREAAFVRQVETELHRGIVLGRASRVRPKARINRRPFPPPPFPRRGRLRAGGGYWRTSWQI